MRDRRGKKISLAAFDRAWRIHNVTRHLEVKARDAFISHHSASAGSKLEVDPEFLKSLEDYAAKSLIITHYQDDVTVGTRAAPPRSAELMLSYVTTPEALEAVMGDMDEAFELQVERFGPAHARRWYWWRAVCSATAFVSQGVRRAVGLEELLRRIGL